MAARPASSSRDGGASSEPVTHGNDKRHPGEVNPFELEYPLTWLKIAEICVGLFLLLPIRSLASVIILGIALVICNIASWGVPMTERCYYKKPITGWRRSLYDWTIPILARTWLFILGFYHIPFKGQMAKPEDAPVLVMAPHSSFFDGLIPLIFPRPFTAVTKLENRGVPLIGVLCDVVAPVYVSRGEKDSRVAAQDEIVSRARQGGWPQILIYVEGTCTNRRALIPFKSGAFAPGVAVQPIVIRYDGSPFIIWTMANPLYLIFVTLCTFFNYASIEFMDPVIPTEDEKNDALLYGDNVRRMMAKHLNIPVTSYSHRDFVRMCKEQDQGGKSS